MRKYIKYQIVTLLAVFYVISGPPHMLLMLMWYGNLA